MVADVIAQALPALVGILVLGALILVHEWGHFLAARRCGILVEEFSMGLGPKLFGFQRGDTLYSIRLLPIGGFCKMLGDDGSSNDERAFNSKPVTLRMIVILAGAFMNIVLAVLLFFVVVSQAGFATARVDSLLPGLPADAAGVLPGDKIVKIGGAGIHTYEDMLLALRQSKGNAVDVIIKRDGQKIVKNVTPVHKGDKYIMGITPVIKTGLLDKAYPDYERAGFLESVSVSFWQMLFWIKTTFYGFGELFARNISVSEMSGPIGVVSIISDTIDNTYESNVKESIWVTVRTLVNFSGMLSASIGIFNLLPIPALDGGRFVFLALEAVRRKPFPQEKEGMVHLIGFAILIALGMFIAYNDILKIL